MIGSYVAQELFGSAQKAVSETLKINGYAFKIVGIVETQDEENMEDGGTDDFVWIPYSVATSLAGSANISSYTLTVSDTDNADTAKTLIQNFLYETFKDSDLYRVTAMSEMLDSLNEQIAMMSGMLGGIAGISLLVAGVGVMNIMLVSVTERTREIGIRKSLGADKGTILQQFVIEAAVTSSLGGVAGILIGLHCHKSGRNHDRDLCHSHTGGSAYLLWSVCSYWPVFWIYACEKGGKLKSDRCIKK